MKAFVINKPFEGVVKDISVPVPSDDEVLIEVKAAGICGTDVHIYKGEYFGEYPRVCGHEFSGIIAKTGKNVKHFSPGMRVAADPNIFCENCIRCKENKQNFCLDFQATGVTRDGAFAQFMTIPEKCVFDIGDLSFKAASMVEPLACVVYGQEKADFSLVSSVLILGAGPIGLMHLQLARINGAYRVDVIDPVVSKLKYASELGADHTYTAEEADNAKFFRFYDMVVDCTGIPSVVESSFKYVKDSGTVVFFGVCPENSEIKIRPYEIFRRELKIISSFALKKTFGKALNLAVNKKIQLECLADNILGIDDLPEYFEDLVRNGNRGLKAIVIK